MPDPVHDATVQLLILSDGKPGHLNQSIAFARLLGLPYEIRPVGFRHRFYRVVSYLFDAVGISAAWLFDVEGDMPSCTAIISAGSNTYYANKVLSRQLGARSVSIMLPRGYRLDFDLIIAQRHDQPPKGKNILSLPINLTCPQPQGLVKRVNDKPCVAFIIGGSSRHYKMDVATIERQIRQVINLFPDADFVATTSRRTPPEVEALIMNCPFRYKVIASQDDINPIADFLAISDFVFVTEDSTSMVSEAVSFGEANVEVLPLAKSGTTNKIQKMIESLEADGYLHIFDGHLGECHRKLDLQVQLRKVWS